MEEDILIEKQEDSSGKAIKKFFMIFILALVVAAAGVLVGQLIPPTLFPSFLILELVVFIIIVLVRKTRISSWLTYSFLFISGIGVYPILIYFAQLFGKYRFFKVLIVAVLIFLVMALLGMLIKFNLGFMKNFLFYMLLALIIVSIVSMFISYPIIVNIIITAGSILLFGLFALYDVHQIARHGVMEKEILSMATKVCLTGMMIVFQVLKLVIFLLQFLLEMFN